MQGPLALVVTCLAACSFTPGKLGDVVPDDAPTDTTPDAGQCSAASVECVNSTTLRQCSAAGALAVDTTCGWGCSSTGPAHCGTLAPAADALTAADVERYPTLVDVTLGNEIIIDTMTGQIGTLANSSSVRGSGPNIINGIYFENRSGVGVIRVNSLRITSIETFPLTFVGTNAIAIVADGEIVIEGYVDARGPCIAATVQLPGPGGFTGGVSHGNGQGPGGGDGTGTNDFGAGGAGHAGVGGTGTTAAVGTAGAAGGSTYGLPEIAMLVGGSGGGGGSAGGNARGGGGGGALQLVSNTRIRIVSGGINAGGCGGESKGGGSDGGGGGGAGGTILLEAPAITVAANAAIAANGGGGGCGKGTGLGEPGRWDATAAGGKTGCTGGDGGAGGALTTLDGATGTTVTGEPGGGGGGAVGRIRLNTLDNTGLTLDTNAIVSPTLATTAATRAAATVQ